MEYLKLIDVMAATKKGFSVDTLASKMKFCVGAADEITASTFFGLYVTVKNTLGLIQYLSEKIYYNYLMTRRLNQDALEVCSLFII